MANIFVEIFVMMILRKIMITVLEMIPSRIARFVLVMVLALQDLSRT